MLQNGQMAIPQPQQTRTTDRTLLPAEQQALNQQVTPCRRHRESPVKVLADTLKLVNLRGSLAPPVEPAQRADAAAAGKLAQTAAEPRRAAYAGGLQPAALPATPQTLLTPAQSQDLLMLLFSRRAERNSETPLADSELRPQPIWAPFVEILPRPLAAPGADAGARLALFSLLWLLR